MQELKFNLGGNPPRRAASQSEMATYLGFVTGVEAEPHGT